MEKVTVKDVAKGMGWDVQTVRNMIDEGILPIAFVLRGESRSFYGISPIKVYKELGLKLGGYDPIDYDKLADKIVEKMKGV